MTLLLMALMAAPLDLSLRDSAPPPAYTQAEHDRQLGERLRYAGAAVTIAGLAGVIAGGVVMMSGPLCVLQPCEAPPPNPAVAPLMLGGLGLTVVGAALQTWSFIIRQRAEGTPSRGSCSGCSPPG